MAVIQSIQKQTGTLIITRRAMTLTLSEDFHSTYTFDREGRFFSCFLSGKNYRRGLDSRVMVKYWDGEQKIRAILTPPETATFFEQVLHQVRILGEHGWEAVDLPTRDWLARIQTWDASRLIQERERFAAAYPSGVGILPPDQYLSIVLQATTGCSWNRCTFCSLYRGKPFTIATPDGFAEHIQRVKALLGSAIGLRRSIFLGDANALIIPQPRLLTLLDLIHYHFPIRRYIPTGHLPSPLSSGASSVGDRASAPASSGMGIYAFLDIFGAERKSFEDYRELHERGVERIYIGLESGDEEVFRLLHKPGSPQEALETVHTIKRAGIYVGIILLVGAGGTKLAKQHITHSSQLVGAMPLHHGDIVYLSPLRIADSMPYLQRLGDMGSRHLSPRETQEQLELLKRALKEAGNQTWVHPSGPPRITSYQIEEFLY